MGDGLISRLKAKQEEFRLGKLNIQLGILRQGSWMLIATIMTGVFNYLSNTFVGRMLGPADYSIFTSLVSLSTVLNVLTGVVDTTTTNYVARRKANARVEEVGELFIILIRQLLICGIIIAFALILISGPLSVFLHIPSVLPVIILALGMVAQAILPIPNGTLRGLQRFGGLGLTQIGAGVFRLAFAVGLIVMGLGATGAIASLSLSSLSAFALGTFLLNDVLQQRKKGSVTNLDGWFKYSFHAAVATIAFAVLTNSDIIIVKNLFSPSKAGLYSAIATLGKITLWLPGAVVMLLLPKAAEQYSRQKTTTNLLIKSLLAAGGLCSGVTVTFLLFPEVIVGVFFGDQYLEHASLLGLYGLAMTIYALVNIWLYYYLAIEEKRYSYVLLVGAILQVVLLMTLPLSLRDVISLLIGTGGCLALTGMLLARASTSAARS